jgi:hypothetical protein
MLLVISIVGVVAVALGVVFGIRAFRRWWVAFGPRAIASQKRVAALERLSDEAWSAAGLLRSHLIERHVPPAISVWEIVPDAGELMFLDVPATYSRYYGTFAATTRTVGYFFGNPTFVLSGIEATAIDEAAHRHASDVASRPSWREWQESRVVVTNKRILCQVAGRWVSFYFSSITAVYPEVAEWTLVCEFGDADVPLLLTGPQAPIVAVMTVLATHGLDGLRDHPSLQRLG